MDVRTTNQEYHELLEDLVERKFYGEVTFYSRMGTSKATALASAIRRAKPGSGCK
jgi:hypothetical protein